MAESAARQLQKSPESATKMVETICHAMHENLGEIQTTIDEEQTMPSIFMMAAINLRKGHDRAATLEASDDEDAKVMYGGVSRQSLHRRQNADQKSRSIFAFDFRVDIPHRRDGRSHNQRKKRKRVKNNLTVR
jgi:hypothetical protein